jgi:GlpG protein
MIGQLADDVQAQKFHDLLDSRGIDSRMEERDDHSWDAWVISEDHVKTATTLRDEYLKDPTNPEYARVAVLGDARRQKELADKQPENEDRWKVLTARDLFHGNVFSHYPVTLILIAISVAVTAMLSFTGDDTVSSWLGIASSHVNGDSVYYRLAEVRHGQVWRLITPIFIHASIFIPFGFMHIFFNMLWLRDLGCMIEARKGHFTMLSLVLVIGVLSNLGQFFMAGPNFGGMSGVVYGLLGYVWMHAKYNPWAGLHMGKDTVIMMIVWFFLCLSGLMGHIANTAHGVGLVVGVAWGYASAMWGRRQHIG